jgi:catechol 2,3-dioxygenase-like lactoylglutathione lyase family enzyme
MAETRSQKFDVRGYNRIALVCSDMKETTDFYTGVLGFPLVKTIQYPDGSQHFFFQATESDSLVFFWSPNPPPSEGAVRIAEIKYDEYGNVLYKVPYRPGPGAFDHLAFDVPLAKLEEYAERLRAAGITATHVNKHLLVVEDGKQTRQVRSYDEVPAGAKYVDEFVNSVYFLGPDGITLEFAANPRELGNEFDLSNPAMKFEDGPRILEERRRAEAAAQAIAN